MKVITHVNVDGPAPLLLKESNTRHLPHSARYWIDKHIDVSLSLLTIYHPLHAEVTKHERDSVKHKYEID